MGREKKMNKGNMWMVMLLAFILIVNILIGVGLGVAVELFDYRISMIHLLMISQTLMFGIPFLIYKGVTKQSFKEILPMKPLDGKNLGYIVAITLLFLPIMMFISALGSTFTNNYVVGMLETATSYPIWVGILAIGVFPSFFEEIIFRGALHKEYERFNIRTAALMNGLFFGIVHLNVQQFLYAAVIGILFTYYRHYTKSMIAPMLGHFIINGINVLMMYAAVMGEGLTDYEMYMMEDVSVWFVVGAVGVVALMVLPILIYVLRKFRDHNIGNVEEVKPELDEDGEVVKRPVLDIYVLISVVIFLGVYLFL